MHHGSKPRLMIKLTLLMFCFSIGYIASSDLPSKPSGPVADYASVFDNATKLKINSIARTLWVEEKFGLIIATVPGIGTIPVEQYTADVYQYWGAGMKTSPENALVLISINPRAAYIHVGEGARRYLPVVLVDRLLAHNGMPDFSKGDFNGGVEKLSHELCTLIHEREYSGTSRSSNGWQHVINYIAAHPVRSAVTGMVFLLLLAVIILSGILRHTHRPDYSGSVFGGGIQSGAFGALFRR